ncbi:MAG: ABC transporter ATP-binding protein [Spirochaetia bacterium]
MNGCRLKKLSKSFRVDGRYIRALDEVDLSINKGDFISVVGYSGCGKSTLLKTIIGLLKPDAGRLEFRGMAGRTSIVFQEPRLISSKSVEKNLLLALKHQKDTSVKEKVLDEVLGILGLTAFRNALPWQLSGGMAQRVALGRALCRQPELLLMDEPFGALDAFNRCRLQRELIQIYQQRGITILFVTHDISEAVLLGNRIIVMSAGKIVRDIEVSLPHPRNKTSPEIISIQNELLATLVKDREPQYIL